MDDYSPFGSPPVPPNEVLSKLLMNQNIVPRQPNNEAMVRALLGDQNVMTETAMPDRGMPMLDRFNVAPQSFGEAVSLAMAAMPGGPKIPRGVAGGSRVAPRTLQNIDDELTAALAGSPKWNHMDAALRSPEQLQAMGFPPRALTLAQERRALVESMDRETTAIDQQLTKLLKGTDVTSLDVSLRGPEGLEKIKRLIPDRVWNEVLSLAQRRRTFE